MGMMMKKLGWFRCALALAALLSALHVEPAAAVYPWEAKCDNASRACERSKYRRQCMCRHGCKAYCNSDDRSEIGNDWLMLAQHSTRGSRNRTTIAPKTRWGGQRINPYHTPGVSRLVTGH
jgi:hypothetical protein